MEQTSNAFLLLGWGFEELSQFFNGDGEEGGRQEGRGGMWLSTVPGALTAMAQVDQARVRMGQGRDRPSRLLEPGLSVGRGQEEEQHRPPTRPASLSACQPPLSCLWLFLLLRVLRSEQPEKSSRFLGLVLISWYMLPALPPTAPGLRPPAFCSTSLVSGTMEDITPIYRVPVRPVPEE